jgi:hypothetical protein
MGLDTIYSMGIYDVSAREVVPPPPEKPWWEQEYFGIPLWAYIVAGVGLAGLAGIMVVRK